MRAAKIFRTENLCTVYKRNVSTMGVFTKSPGTGSVWKMWRNCFDITWLNTISDITDGKGRKNQRKIIFNVHSCNNPTFSNFTFIT